ncbi:MAG: hypothetical protein P9M14_00655 [Candidatus Alcyoniella australis]|nr:hypothetical protein [Candidatus Alcyoniella australis]
MKQAIKNLCLIEELTTAHNLIEIGLGELQEINMGNDFYHLPHLLLANGFERLMKSYFCLVYEARNGQYPDNKFLKDMGHNLSKLKKLLIDEYYNTNGNSILTDDLNFLQNDLTLQKIIDALSEFGQKARYYNLDVITGRNINAIDPKSKWEEIEVDIENPSGYYSEEDDYFPRVNAAIIAKLERLLRSVAMQFTHGDHGGRLKQNSPTLSRYRRMNKDDFGKTDYRRSVKTARQSQDKWIKRSKKKILESKWPTLVIKEEDFEQDWPFRCDEVIIECREKFLCVINIEEYDFALDGAARSFYGYPYPHDVGFAILGKSVEPFIQRALKLGE